MKLKSTFSGAESLKEKRSSVFYYSDMSPTPDIEDPEEEKSSPDSDENTVIENLNTSEMTKEEKQNCQTKEYDGTEEYSADIQFLSGEDANSTFDVGSMGSQYEIPVNKRGSCATRPDKLDLVDEDGYPKRPPRRAKNKTPDKRDQRLLSVPNIKFQKPELQLLRDLRYNKEEAAQPPPTQPSFAGSLMRRFSKS